MDDMITKGRQQHVNGEEHYNARLTIKQVTIIRNSQLSPKELSMIYGVSRVHIYSIRNFTKWKNQNELAEVV